MEGDMSEGISSPPFPLPLLFFFCSCSKFRAITRLETLATQATLGLSQFGLKRRRGGIPGPLPWIRHCFYFVQDRRKKALACVAGTIGIFKYK